MKLSAKFLLANFAIIFDFLSRFFRFSDLEDSADGNSTLLHDQRKLSVRDCVGMFKDSLDSLKQLYKERGELVWDKV